jgi:NADH:ubiquinone oxidoreductase subunit 5 (subunit L)/multisubunit Na+/H+ antiporter MnhA subunit
MEAYRGKAHPHESPLTMTIPLMVLAVLSVVGGLLNLPHLFGGHEPMKHFLETAAADGIGYEHLDLERATEWILMGITTTLVLARHLRGLRPLREDAPRWRAKKRPCRCLQAPDRTALAHRRTVPCPVREALFGLVEHTTSSPWRRTRVMIPLMNGVGDAASAWAVSFVVCRPATRASTCWPCWRASSSSSSSPYEQLR